MNHIPPGKVLSDRSADITAAEEYKDRPITFTLYDARGRQLEIKIVEPELEYPLPENDRLVVSEKDDYITDLVFKFNPESAFGNLEKIDMRSEEEIWLENKRPKNLKILNPAFETITRRYISGLITEEGIFPASSVSLVFRRTYPNLIEEKIIDNGNGME